MPATPVLTHPELYCVVPDDLCAELLEPLSTALARRGIRAIPERRDPRALAAYEIRRQRALHLPRAFHELPAEFARHAESLTFVQRMPSPGLTYADAGLLEVVAAVRGGDAVACSELVWRMHARVTARLTRYRGQVAGLAMIDATMGAMLDAIDSFAGREDVGFLAWLDSLIDAR